MMERESMIQQEAAPAAGWHRDHQTAVLPQPEEPHAVVRTPLSWISKLPGLRETVTPV